MLKMIKKRLISSNLFFRIRREVTTCALPVDPLDMAVSVPSGDHKNFCHSLADQLIQRGLFSSAQLVIQRMISHSMSVGDAISVANSVVGRGLDLDVDSYAVLIRKLVTLGEPQLAESLYLVEIESRGNNPDPSILNSMVICSCELGKVEDAINHFNRLLSSNYVPQKEACLSILRQFCAQERYLDAFNLFRRAHFAEATLSFGCYRLLIDGLCHKGHLDEALQIFDMLQNYHKHLPTVHTYKSLFYGLCKGSRVVEAGLIFGEMESRGMYIDKTMYTSLVQVYCRDRKMKVAMQVFFRMLKTGYQPDRCICNILIDGFMKLSLYDKVRVIHDKMMEWGVKPDVATYQVMISQYCKEGKIDCALTLLHNMIDSEVAPNVHCYTVLFSALYEHNKMENFYDLFKSMMESGVIPDHVLYLKLMKILPVCKLQLAFTILLALAKNGCGIDPVLPASGQNPDDDFEQEIALLLERIVRKNINLTTVAYSIFISALCEKGEIDKALICLEKIDDAGYRSMHFSYNSIIKCLIQMGLFEDANYVIDLMEDRGLAPNQATFLIIINELCKRGNMVSAMEFLDQMEKRGMKPSVAIYNSIIGCLVKEGKIIEAEDMFMRMLMCGVDPDEAVCTTMICGYSKNGRLLEAQELFDTMIEISIKPSYRSFTALISGLVKKHMIDEGCFYLDKMFENGMVPNAVLYTSLILDFLKNREFKVVLKLVNLVGKNGVTWDLFMCMSFVNGVRRYICRNDNKNYHLRRRSERGKQMLLYLLDRNPFPEKENSLRVPTDPLAALKWLARKLIKDFKGAAITDNLHLNNCIISWLCGEGMINDAYHHLQLMQKEGVPPNHVTYTILVCWHLRLYDIDNAVRLFNKMNIDGCVPDRIAYDTLLKGFIRAGRLLDAMSLVYSMRKRGLYPTRASYEMLLYCFYRSGLSVSGNRIFEEMIADYYHRILHDHYWSPYNLCESNSRLHEDQLIYDTFQRALYMGQKLLLSG